MLTWCIGRLRPIAPPAAWSIILTARSLAGQGVLVLEPTAERVLIVAPHPDDETIGCGGTLAALAGRGAKVDVLLATSGEAGVGMVGLGVTETAAARRGEAVAACEMLGLMRPNFLDLPDGALLEHVEALSRGIKAIVEDTSPEAIFVPWPLDGHPDHQATAMALARVDLPVGIQIWAYEVWSVLPANRIVDITRYYEVKARALACYRATLDPGEAAAHLSLDRWRSLFGLHGHGHAEAFLVLEPAAMRRLVDGGQVGSHGAD